MALALARTRFGRAVTGSAAVEFAMIAPLLFALLIGTFDAGGVMVKSMLLERSVDIATRLIRTGAPEAAADAAGLKTQICARTILKLGDCANRLTVELTAVTKSADFPTLDVTCVTKSVPKPTVKYAAGGRSDLIYVRACLTVDPFVPLIGTAFGLPRSADGDFRIVVVTTYTNEP